MSRHPGSILAVTLLILLGACTSSETTTPVLEPADLDERPLRVVGTTSIIGDVVGQVGGEAIQLDTLLQPGQDPHAYEPSPQDIATLNEADVIFINGLGLEENLESVLHSIEGEVLVISLDQGISMKGGKDTGDLDHSQGDPHVWLDVDNVITWVETIENALGTLDPSNQGTYQANAESYTSALETLDSYIVEQTSYVPEENRQLITNHDSLGYFADRYGYEIIGTVIPSYTTSAEPSAGDLAELIGVIEEERASTIFIETTASDQLAGTIADELGYPIRIVVLYTGSLGEAGSGAESYIRMMQLNIDRIVSGLKQ